MRLSSRSLSWWDPECEVKVRDRVATYRRRLRELTPEEVRPSRLRRSTVVLRGAVVLAFLDFNDFLIGRFAAGLPARWDPAVYPWAAEVQAAWPEMRAEMVEFLRTRVIPETAEINGLDPASEEARVSVPADVGAWRSLPLEWFGEPIAATAGRFPATMRAVAGRGFTSVGFTALDPRAHIAAHRGPNRGALRYQLPIIVPGPPGACRIRVGDEMVTWTVGEPVVFDLSVDHEVWNDTDEVRVILMIEVPTPLPFPLSIVNRLAQRSYRFFPTFAGLPQRVAALNTDTAHRVAA